MTVSAKPEWQVLCHRDDLVPGGGVCVLVGRQQVALFYLPREGHELFAIGNRDPIGGASVLSRGIVGSVGDRLVVASPLYKQHFDLVTGACLEDGAVVVPVYEVRCHGDCVLIRR